jgi:bifunctional pyridoxal-dependent enzyme with beta-cystathionase and maltose regulon repressor activities
MLIWVYTLHVGMGNVFGFEALHAAYEEGDQWRMSC